MRNTHIANARIGSEHLEIIAINDGMALVENLKGEQREVQYTDLVDVWPLSATLDNFDSLVTVGFEVADVTGMIKVFTGSAEWADYLATKWSELY